MADLVEKYAQERAKRLRADGMSQYISTQSSIISDLGQDPWVDYDAIASQDPPLKHGDKIKFLIIGGGHHGLLFAYRLIEAGFRSEEICVVDVAGGFGGTWYWNRYPGLMCDIEGYIYLPLLEETGYIPKHKYSYGAEIRAQSERIAARWKIRGLFSTKVNSQVWNDTTGHWEVEMTQNLGPKRLPLQISVQAQFILPAGGVLSIPKIPHAPGLNEFRRSKHMFHTSRWNYAYTGGSQEAPEMSNLRDKRVAIIGTGATAIQAVPELAKWAKHLYVIQRTPSYCGERNQRETDLESWPLVADQAGWQNKRRINFNHFVTNDPVPQDLVDDGWTHTPGVAGLIGSRRLVTADQVEQHVNSLLELDKKRTNWVRDHISQQVHDEDAAEKLKPWYPSWCKRPAFNDDYLPAFNRSNVTLVDTNGKGIESYTDRGVVCNGEEIEIDVLVMATGFVTANSQNPAERLGSTIIGRDGRSIGDKWQSGDFGTFFGIATHQFPNMFATLLSGTAGSYNLTSSYDVVARLVAYIVAEASRRVADPEKLVIETTKEAEDRYTEEVQKRALWYSALPTCTPSYFTAEGERLAKPKDPEKAKAKSKQPGWGGGIVDYQHRAEEYMGQEKDDKLGGFAIRGP